MTALTARFVELSGFDNYLVRDLDNGEVLYTFRANDEEDAIEFMVANYTAATIGEVQLEAIGG